MRMRIAAEFVDFFDPQSNPQTMMSWATFAYFGSPRGLVSYCKTYLCSSDKERSQWFEPSPPTITFIGYQALSQDLDPQSNPHLSDFAAPTAYRLAARRDILVAPPESTWTEANHQVGSEAQIVSDIVHAITEN